MRMAYLMDRYVVHCCMKMHVPPKPAPAYASPKKLLQQRKAYTAVHPEAVWSLIEKARDSGCSIDVLVRTRQDDPEILKASVTQCSMFMGKYHEMYDAQRTMAFSGVSNLSLVADPSTHSKRDTLVSVAYAWEDNQAAIGDIQFMPATTKLLKADMPDAIAELWLERKLERIASYQQLQAISNTIKNLGFPKALETFALPENLEMIQPVKNDEVRIISTCANTVLDVAKIYNKSTGETRNVLPDGLPSAFPLLVLSLDQGAEGAAGAAFMEGRRNMLVTCRWDKFHRCIRDIKLSIQHTAHGLFF